jgi:uncharacterized RmlC-like cupin family protein
MEERHHHDADGRWVGLSGWIQEDADEMSGWHHHAANDTFVYVIRGSVTTEFGPGGADHIEARAGDLFFIPSITIHRERTGSERDFEAFILRIGGQPERVDVDGPG